MPPAPSGARISYGPRRLPDKRVMWLASSAEFERQARVQRGFYLGRAGSAHRRIFGRDCWKRNGARERVRRPEVMLAEHKANPHPIHLAAAEDVVRRL